MSNIIEFPSRPISAAASADPWLLNLVRQTGLPDGAVAEILRRVQPLLDVLDRPITAEVGVCEACAPGVDRFRERIHEAFSERFREVIAERVAREVEAYGR